MSGLLKVIAGFVLVFGTIGSFVLGNAGYEFSFFTFLVSELEVLVSFLTLFGIGYIWGRQDEIQHEHNEIIRAIREKENKDDKSFVPMLNQISNSQNEIIEILKKKPILPLSDIEKEEEIIPEPQEEKPVIDDAPRAVVVERTYDDIRRKKAATGWKCKKCGKNNILSRRTCIECGEPK